MKTTIIIGAGASGLLCGCELAKHDENVIILEQSNKSGRKILASGNGRCNLSNLDLALSHYNTDDKKIANIIGYFDAREYFESIGVMVKANGKLLYPRSNQSLTIKNALMNNFDNVALIENCQALKITKQQDGYLVTTNLGKYHGDNIVIATGSKASGLSGTNNYDLVNQLGLQITKLAPSLVQLKTNPHYRQLKGVRIKCLASLLVDGKVIERQDGEVLFNEAGLSGICIMQLSRLLPHYQGKKEISLDLMPDFSYHELLDYLSRRKKQFGDYYFAGIFNDKLAKIIPEIDNIKDWRFKIIATGGFDKAQVTSGGVSLQEVDENLESYQYPNLYLTGELLDVDGDCGGYNLHFAFASGYHVAKTILKKNEVEYVTNK